MTISQVAMENLTFLVDAATKEGQRYQDLAAKYEKTAPVHSLHLMNASMLAAMLVNSMMHIKHLQLEVVILEQRIDIIEEKLRGGSNWQRN